MTEIDPRVHRLRMGEFGIPLRLRQMRHGQHTSPEAQDFVTNLRDHLVTANRPVEEYPEDITDIGKGLMWAGPPGTGKTSEATATLLACYLRWNIPVRFIAFSDYIASRKEQWSLERKAEGGDEWWTIQTMISAVRHAPVLLIDDVGKEAEMDKSRFAANELDLLLRQRHRDAQPTLITTNVPPGQWGKTYNESMGSFIREAFTVIAMTGKDRRERRA